MKETWKIAKMLFGIALILCGILLSADGMNYFSLVFGAIGLIVCIFALVGSAVNDNEKDKANIDKKE